MSCHEDSLCLLPPLVVQSRRLALKRFAKDHQRRGQGATIVPDGYRTAINRDFLPIPGGELKSAGWYESFALAQDFCDGIGRPLARLFVHNS